MAREIYQIEPELQSCPRATIFDGTYGDVNPKFVVVLALLLCGAISYPLFTPRARMDIVLDGLCLILVTAIVVAVTKHTIRTSKIRKLVEQGTPVRGSITRIDQTLGTKGKMVDKTIYYTYEGHAETNVQSRLARHFHKLHPGMEVTILTHPQYGDAIYRLCCYKAVPSTGSP
jgi:hypothetical protein